MATPAELSAATWRFWHTEGPARSAAFRHKHSGVFADPAFAQDFNALEVFFAEQYPRDAEMLEKLGAPLVPPVEPVEPPEPPIIVIDPPAAVVAGRTVRYTHSGATSTGNNALATAVANVPPRNDGKRSEIAVDGWCEWASFKNGGNVNIRGLDGHRAQIKRNPASGSDTLAFFPGVNNVHFYDLDIHLSDRALCITVERAATAPPTMGLGFHRCVSLGGYDHVAESGPTSKWGWLLNMTGDFTLEDCNVYGIQKEHFLYSHNARGDFRVKGNTVSRVGRTFCQFVNRPKESSYTGLPEGIGTVLIADNVIEDAGCSLLDAGHGGSAITIAGRHSGQVIVARNYVRLGFADDLFNKLAPLSKPGQQPFNACSAVWDGGDTPNAYVLMDQNDYEMASRAGIDATLICDGTHLVELRRNRFVAGKPGTAAHFDRPGRRPCGSIVWESSNVAVGNVMRNGQQVVQP